MHEVTQMDGFTFIKRLAWLQQILHNGGCVKILERHRSSANLMKIYVNPNVNALSLSHTHTHSHTKAKPKSKEKSHSLCERHNVPSNLHLLMVVEYLIFPPTK